MTYKYDEDGRRIQKNVNGVITNYHYQGDSLNVLYETDADGNVVRSYIYGENGQLLAMKKGNATYFYHYNAHGDVIALTDEQGNIVARYQYDAWGNILSQSGALADENPYRYAGYQYDKETGLYYLIARYYHPTHGVFLSLDPDPGDEDDVLTQNGYNYVSNNPVMLTDSDGRNPYLIVAAYVIVRVGTKYVVKKVIKKKIPKKIKVNKGIYNRKKHYGNGTRKSVRDAVLKRDNYTCQYCGRKGGKLEVDHNPSLKQHYYKKGYAMSRKARIKYANNPKYLKTACQRCNRSKQERYYPDEWRP